MRGAVEVGLFELEAEVFPQVPGTSEKVALVSDIDGMNNAVKAFGFPMPCPVKVCFSGEIDAAKEWIGG